MRWTLAWVVTLGIACGPEAPTQPMPTPVASEAPTPVVDTESAKNVDPTVCDEELVRLRKCIDAADLDTLAREQAVSSVVTSSEFWALRRSLEPKQRQVVC